MLNFVILHQCLDGPIAKVLPWSLIMALRVPNLEKMFATKKEETIKEELVLVGIASTPWKYNLLQEPDYLSVSFGYTKYQSVLGIPLGSPKTKYVPTRSQIERVRGRASSGVPLYKTLIGKVEARAKASWRLTRSDRGEP
ncbi:hypothetical protein E6C27_scaffold154G00560 [Cucumis melo var. makuwa]|uniref:Uncharacterized protein n=1 Tax=Cucumis melo var. makuwa TaxID=1194695 RepID=A0A5A7V9D0_CUCMM|nr:hypothetical protein E6C27_scaffold154G00560 [Cucumis melo var. makuwa]